MLLQFIKRFHSFDYINSIGKTRFMNSYITLAHKVGERNASTKGLSIYELSKLSVTTHSNSEYMSVALDQCVDILSDSQRAADEIILKMQNIAETIPEYKILREMNGVGDRLGPIILAEIGDIRRFHSGKAHLMHMQVMMLHHQSPNRTFFTTGTESQQRYGSTGNTKSTANQPFFHYCFLLTSAAPAE